MLILGIDPSISRTGWAIIQINNNKIKYIDSGDIPTLKIKTDNYFDKIKFIVSTINEVLLKYSEVKCCGIESTFLNKNPGSSIKLGVVRGAIIGQILQANIKVEEYSPNQIKKYITGHGRADKSSMGDFLERFFQIKVKSHDEADAVAVAITAYFSNRF